MLSKYYTCTFLLQGKFTKKTIQTRHFRQQHVSHGCCKINTEAETSHTPIITNAHTHTLINIQKQLCKLHIAATENVLLSLQYKM